MSLRDNAGAFLKEALNDLFRRTRASGAIRGILSGSNASLSIAALNWVALEIDSYTDLISSRECEKVKVWKLPQDSIWTPTLDVDIRLKVSGGIAQPALDLKVIVKFQKLTCLLELNDWTTHYQEEVPGRVVKMKDLFKVERIPPSPRPSTPDRSPIDDEYEEVPV
jgi:hypothetical protein